MGFRVDGTWYSDEDLLEQMLGKTPVRVHRGRFDDGYCDGDCLDFYMSDGTAYRFYHSMDCCESVGIEDVTGDLEDLVGEPLLRCECVASNNQIDGEWGDSITWTFYKFATLKGYVTVRWRGESNGYYSESVDLTCFDPSEPDYDES